MKKNVFLQDALGLIDDDMILDAKLGRKNHRNIWIKWGSVAASIVLVIVILVSILLSNGFGANYEPAVMDNLWEKDGFRAFSLSYNANPQPQMLSLSYGKENTLVEDVISSKPISITADKTMKLESLIAERYLVAYEEPYMTYSSEPYNPVLYDVVADREINLENKILGENKPKLDSLMTAVFQKAEELYPGMLASEKNREILQLCVQSWTRRVLVDDTAVDPDTDFFDAIPELEFIEENQRAYAFVNECCTRVYFDGYELVSEEYYLVPFCIRVFAVDPINGVCFILVRDVIGNGLDYLAYDVVKDTVEELPNSFRNSLLGTMLGKNEVYHFSNDGTIASVTYIDGGWSGGHVSNYKGEHIGVFYLQEGRAYQLDDENIKGASKAYISDSGSVVYFKKMQQKYENEYFLVSNTVLSNRLELYHHADDAWVFYTIDPQKVVADKKIILEGKFVRLIAEDTVVIMEREGVFRAFSLQDGTEITSQILNGKIKLMAHEFLKVYYEEGYLYKENLFSQEERQMIAKADSYVLSHDGAFAFVYQRGDSFVTCINIATLESCTVEIDQTLCKQVFETENAVFRMLYNEEENTLLFSFYVEEGMAQGQEGLDFYALLEELNTGTKTMITDIVVGQEVMDAFRDSIKLEYGGGGTVPMMEYRFPCGLKRKENQYTVFEKLGITPPESFLDVNGTEFILYQDEDELLKMEFREGWLLANAGIDIYYTCGDTEYWYQL